MTIQTTLPDPSINSTSDPFETMFAPYVVIGAYTLGSMQFRITYLIGESVEPLRVVIECIRRLWKSRDGLATLLQLGATAIKPPKRQSHMPPCQIHIRNDQEDAHLVIVDVGCVFVDISLPHPIHWTKAGLDWLRNHCHCCRADRDEFLPWLHPRCKNRPPPLEPSVKDF